MKLDNMFKKTRIVSRIQSHSAVRASRPEVPEGLLRKCNKCGAAIIAEDVKQGYYICPKCGGYFRVHAYRRIQMVIDEGTFEEWNKEMPFSNPLDFPNYEKKVEAAREKTNLNEAIVIGKAKIDGNPAVVGVCDARFIMSSMGHVVGEKITEAVERATKEKLPVILFACSGGARMQEGIVSLMQMAKTSAALKRHHEAGQLFISVLTDPTTGGVTASFAMLGDIIIAEPGALIGFAGPRVIEQTIGQKLPEGFQRAEFLLDHGFVDMILPRQDQKHVIGRILYMHRKQDMDVEENGVKTDIPVNTLAAPQSQENTEKSAWDTVLLSRKADRPTALDYINAVFDEFMEFHGDRCFKDDGAIVGGIAMFHGMPVTVIGQQKGKNTKDNIRRNFGMPSPDGYRKALRLMKQAETFGRPIICFVDTPGAFCGLEAEERGQGEAIARNLFEMSDLKVPVLSIVIGEGGSGGALAIGICDRMIMLENAIYSILSPEGFASILWKDGTRWEEASEVMRLTAPDLKKMNVCDVIVPEPGEGAHEQRPFVFAEVEKEVAQALTELQRIRRKDIAELRYRRLRNVGRELLRENPWDSGEEQE